MKNDRWRVYFLEDLPLTPDEVGLGPKFQHQHEGFIIGTTHHCTPILAPYTRLLPSQSSWTLQQLPTPGYWSSCLICLYDLTLVSDGLRVLPFGCLNFHADVWRVAVTAWSEGRRGREGYPYSGFGWSNYDTEWKGFRFFVCPYPVQQSYKIHRFEGQKRLLPSLHLTFWRRDQRITYMVGYTLSSSHQLWVRTSLPPSLMGFQTSRFLSEPFFKLWSLSLALGSPQIQQLLPLTGIMVFLSTISSNYFYFSISLGPICARLHQNSSSFFKKIKTSWDSSFLAKMRCVRVLQPALSVPAIPIKWSTCQMRCLDCHGHSPSKNNCWTDNWLIACS